MNEKTIKPVLVTLEKGTIEGINENDVDRFLGVPYAEANEYFKPAYRLPQIPR